MLIQTSALKPQAELAALRELKLPAGTQCATCGFRYSEYKGHIIPCPLCHATSLWQMEYHRKREAAEQLRGILESSLATAQRQLAESKHQTEGLAEVLKKIALEDPTADWAGKVAREALAVYCAGKKKR